MWHKHPQKWKSVFHKSDITSHKCGNIIQSVTNMDCIAL
jgi:hypothetical protein